MSTFGLCSAPKIFTVVANALQWILLQQGLQDLIHYLDNFSICRTAWTARKCLICGVGNMCSTWGIHSTGKAEEAGHGAQFCGHRVGLAEAVCAPAG